MAFREATSFSCSRCSANLSVDCVLAPLPPLRREEDARDEMDPVSLRSQERVANPNELDIAPQCRGVSPEVCCHEDFEEKDKVQNISNQASEFVSRSISMCFGSRYVTVRPANAMISTHSMHADTYPLFSNRKPLVSKMNTSETSERESMDVSPCVENFDFRIESFPARHNLSAEFSRPKMNKYVRRPREASEHWHVDTRYFSNKHTRGTTRFAKKNS